MFVASASPLLPGCGGGAALSVPADPPPFAQRNVERLPTPWSEADGRAQTLEAVVYRPLRPGPHPTVVFHHGSTGNGDDPSLFTQTFDSPTQAREWVGRGYMVVFPQRRGRGRSDGVYEEGFEPDRSRYSCRAAFALPGFERALEDVDAITRALLNRTDVDRVRLVLAGVSRGGALAIAHAARRPGVYRGVVNFVGGWLGEGCVDAVLVNQQALAAPAGPPPTLWLYGENDPFYSIAHSRSHFDAYLAAGGAGEYHALRRADAGASGHLVHQEPTLWRALLDGYLAARAP